MKRVLLFPVLMSLFIGCASHVRFIQTDDSYTIKPKSDSAVIVFKRDKINRPHKVIGVIEAQLGRKATRSDLDALLRKKGKEIGADGIMLVDYDVDRTVYLERHHAVVGRGPFKRHVVGTRARKKVDKTARGIAVIFR